MLHVAHCIKQCTIALLNIGSVALHKENANCRKVGLVRCHARHKGSYAVIPPASAHDSWWLEEALFKPQLHFTHASGVNKYVSGFWLQSCVSCVSC